MITHASILQEIDSAHSRTHESIYRVGVASSVDAAIVDEWPTMKLECILLKQDSG